MGIIFSRVDPHEHCVPAVHQADHRKEDGNQIEESMDYVQDSNGDLAREPDAWSAWKDGQNIIPIAATGSSDPTLSHSQRFIELHRENNIIAEAFHDELEGVKWSGGSILSAWLAASQILRDVHASQKLARFEDTASIITNEWRNVVVEASSRPVKDVARELHRLEDHQLYVADKIKKNHTRRLFDLINRFLQKGFDFHDLALQLHRILESFPNPVAALKQFEELFDELEPFERLLQIAPALEAQFRGYEDQLVKDHDNGDDKRPGTADRNSAQWKQHLHELGQETENRNTPSSPSTPSIPSTPRTSDIQGPSSPPFTETFDALRTSISVPPRRRPTNRYKDARIPRVDPLRYQNRLEEPRRLPNTPTVSHQPPRPRSHTRTPESRACSACGRVFRKRVAKSAQKSSAKKGSTAAGSIVAPRWPTRARKATKIFGA